VVRPYVPNYLSVTDRTIYVIPAKSAHPERVKRSSLTQERVRRLLNVSPTLPDSERVHVITSYDEKIRYCGYKKGFRWNVIDTAYKIYNEKVEQSKAGTSDSAQGVFDSLHGKNTGKLLFGFV
jgi:hypothetical protein